MDTRLEDALCGTDNGGWVSPSAFVTRKGDMFLVEGFVNGEPRKVLSTFPGEMFAPIRAALAEVAIEDPHMDT